MFLLCTEQKTKTFFRYFRHSVLYKALNALTTLWKEICCTLHSFVLHWCDVIISWCCNVPVFVCLFLSWSPWRMTEQDLKKKKKMYKKWQNPIHTFSRLQVCLRFHYFYFNFYYIPVILLKFAISLATHSCYNEVIFHLQYCFLWGKCVIILLELILPWWT